MREIRKIREIEWPWPAISSWVEWSCPRAKRKGQAGEASVALWYSMLRLGHRGSGHPEKLVYRTEWTVVPRYRAEVAPFTWRPSSLEAMPSPGRAENMLARGASCLLVVATARQWQIATRCILVPVRRRQVSRGSEWKWRTCYGPNNSIDRPASDRTASPTMTWATAKEGGN